MSNNYYDEDDDNNSEDDQNENEGGRALELKFSIGYNSAMTGAIHNLTLPSMTDNNDKKSEIFFPAAHTGVIYNYQTGDSKLLQGHCNAITAVSTTYDQTKNVRYIVTADSGKKSIILIWNAEDASVVSHIEHGSTDQIVSIDFSRNIENNGFIAFLTHQKNDEGKVELQKIYIYQWYADPKVTPVQIYYTEFGVDDGEVYYDLKFNPNPTDYIEYLVTSPHRIFFSVLDTISPEKTKAYYPNDSRTEKNSLVHYTQSIFLKSTSKTRTDAAITGTSAGYIIVWDVCEALCKEDQVVTDRRRIKEVDLLGRYKKDKDKKFAGSEKDYINILVNYEDYIVIGTGGGTVNFYDYNFIIVRWFENICWMVKSISFDMCADNYRYSVLEKGKNSDEPADTDKFSCVPFIISDISGTVKRIYADKEPLISVGDEKLKYEEIYRGVESEITCIAVHPKKNLIAIGTRGICPYPRTKISDMKPKDKILKEKKFEYKAYVQIFTYPNHMKSIQRENEKREEEEKRRKAKKSQKKNGKKGLYGSDNATAGNDDDDLDEKHNHPHKKYFNSDTYPTVLEFSPCGDDILMVGTSFQKILPLNVKNIQVLAEKQTILQIKEIADKDGNAEIQEIIFSPDNKHFAAADNKRRIGLFFKDKNGTWTLTGRYNSPDPIMSFCFNEDGSQLYSITQRNLCVFNATTEDSSSKELSPHNDYLLNYNYNEELENDCNLNKIIWYPGDEKEKKVLIANDQFKLRIVNVQDTPKIVKTSLGPCFGGPIVNMKPLIGKEKDKRLIAFTTQEKIMGLMLLPLDGNPYKYMGVIAHPGNIKDMKPAASANYIFTTGGKDFTINIWKYNYKPLYETVSSKGDGIEPFLELLEGGKEGSKFKEMVDFFYYAQISSKNEHTTKHRVLDQTVSASQINGLLASLGYYPSQKDVTNIINEVKHAKFIEGKGEKNDDINFEGFVKIFLNHRPYIETDVDSIEHSFNKMKKATNYHTIKDTNQYILEKKDLIACLRKKHLDEENINYILKVLDDNPEKDISKPEHYQKEIKIDVLSKALESCKVDTAEKDDIIHECISPDLNSNNNNSVLYKIISNVIHRDNFFNMLKENGEKMDDKEINEILRVLKGVNKVEDLPLFISFDDLFGDILRMEKVDKEVDG